MTEDQLSIPGRDAEVLKQREYGKSKDERKNEEMGYGEILQSCLTNEPGVDIA